MRISRKRRQRLRWFTKGRKLEQRISSRRLENQEKLHSQAVLAIEKRHVLEKRTLAEKHRIMAESMRQELAKELRQLRRQRERATEKAGYWEKAVKYVDQEASKLVSSQRAQMDSLEEAMKRLGSIRSQHEIIRDISGRMTSHVAKSLSKEPISDSLREALH